MSRGGCARRIALAWLAARPDLSDASRLAVITGFLGGLTDLFDLLGRGRCVAAAGPARRHGAARRRPHRRIDRGDSARTVDGDGLVRAGLSSASADRGSGGLDHRLGVDLEMPPQRRPRVAAAEAVGAEREGGAAGRQGRTDLVRHGAHVVAGEDERARWWASGGPAGGTGAGPVRPGGSPSPRQRRHGPARSSSSTLHTVAAMPRSAASTSAAFAGLVQHRARREQLHRAVRLEACFAEAVQAAQHVAAQSPTAATAAAGSRSSPSRSGRRRAVRRASRAGRGRR